MRVLVTIRVIALLVVLIFGTIGAALLFLYLVIADEIDVLRAAWINEDVKE
jgi:hypothetical protein